MSALPSHYAPLTVPVDVSLAYSVDQAGAVVRADANGDPYPSDQRKHHRPRASDTGLAACSRRVLLNTVDEPGQAPADLTPTTLCRRCFPGDRS